MNRFVKKGFLVCCGLILDNCIFWEMAKSGSTNETPSGMILVSARDRGFQMGETGLAEPVHRVTFTYDFYMDTTEVTQKDYQFLMGVNPSYFRGDRRPVERVSWFDALLYCNKRSLHDGLDTVYRYTGISGTPGDGVDSLRNLTVDYSKKGYRLPTEAEWEYAYRAGTHTLFYWGDQEGSAAGYAWYSDNSGDSTRPVAGKIPNAFGLYDMAGNVYEWTSDLYGEYDSLPLTDPRGADSGSFHALRSGCWFNVPTVLHAAFRGKEPAVDRNLDVGFRCARTR